MFALVAEGDSLSFWISADSMMSQASYLKTSRLKAGTQVKHTVKILKVRSKAEIKKELKQKYATQYKKDSLLIGEYLSEVKKKEIRLDVHTTESGLYYYIRKVGKGNPPIEGDTVMLNYTSKLIDGTVYEKSESPTEFVIGNTLPLGLNEGLALMNEGASSVFILPSTIGFGETPPDTNIPLNAVLVFEVDLLARK